MRDSNSDSGVGSLFSTFEFLTFAPSSTPFVQPPPLTSCSLPANKHITLSQSSLSLDATEYLYWESDLQLAWRRQGNGHGNQQWGGLPVGYGAGGELGDDGRVVGRVLAWLE